MKYLACLILIFFTPYIVNAQLEGKITLLADQQTYQVSVIAGANWNPPSSITNSAQITLVVPAGGFYLVNLQNVTGEWTHNTTVRRPAENPESDYLSIALSSAIRDYSYVAGEEVILFTFQNFGICTGPVSLINNDTDPFIPPNSLDVNVGNQFAVLAAGPGVNAYSGNSPMEEVACPDTDNCTIITGIEVNNDGRYQIHITPEQTWGAPDNTTQFMQFTLKIPTGGFNVDDLRTLVNGVTWEATIASERPTEAPEFDYININLTTIGTNAISYEQGVTLPLFEFVNRDTCTENLIALINNTTDLFNSPNSENVDVGNYIETTGSGSRIDLCFEGSETAECIFTDGLPLSVGVMPVQEEVACADDATTITVTASGDEPPYMITWTNTTTGETGTATIDTENGQFVLDPAIAGDYTFMITGSLGSTAEITSSIIAPSPITATLDSSPTTCPDNPDGTAQVIDIDGGTLSTDYVVVWQTPEMTEGRELTNLTAGTYTAIITDDNNCSITRMVEVGASEPMSVLGEIFPISCSGKSDANIELTIEGGSMDYTATWSDNAPSGNTAGAAELAAGVYEVTITDNTNGCTITDTYEVPSIEPIEIELSVVPPACSENAGSITVVGVNNGLEPYVFSMNGVNFSTQTKFTDLTPGIYGVIVQDAEGCETTVEAVIPSGDVPSLELGEDLTIQSGDSILLESITSADTTLTYQWNSDFNLSCDTCANPVAKPTKSFTYQLEVSNAAGCKVSDRITIFVDKTRQLYFPTAFSPNDDGFNDFFTVYGDDKIVSVNKFEIFDRWGEKQFAADDTFEPGYEPNGWDGTFRGKNAAIGIYVYQVEITFTDGETELFAGEITLMR